MVAPKVATLLQQRMTAAFSTTRSIKETRARRLSARNATLHSEASQCRRVTLTRFRSRRLRSVIEECSRTRRHNLQRLTSHSSNTTIAIMRGCLVCFAIVATTTPRNLRCPAKLHTRLVQAVTHNSSQTRQVRFARSVTRTCRAARSKPSRRCGVSMHGSITQNTPRRRVRLVIEGIEMAWDSRFHRACKRTSRVSVVTRQVHRQTERTFLRAARVIRSDGLFALQSRRLRTGLDSVTQITMGRVVRVIR